MWGSVHDCFYSSILSSLPVYLVDLVGIISNEFTDSTTLPSICSQPKEFLRKLVALTLMIFTVMRRKFQQDGKNACQLSIINPNHNQFLILLLKNPSEYCSRPKCPNTSLKTPSSILLICTSHHHECYVF
jgi:hypothetical protein